MGGLGEGLITSALSKIEAVIDVQFVERLFSEPDPYYENLALVPYWEDSTSLGWHQVPEEISVVRHSLIIPWRAFTTVSQRLE